MLTNGDKLSIEELYKEMSDEDLLFALELEKATIQAAKKLAEQHPNLKYAKRVLYARMCSEQRKFQELRRRNVI